jgi:hypothetical protein
VYNVLFSTALSNLEKCLFNSPPSAETIFRFLFSIHVSFLGCLTAFFWDGSRVISASGNILRYTVFQRKNFAVRVHRRTPTADAINGCGLRTDGEDIPPAARVRQSCTTAEQSQKTYARLSVPAVLPAGRTRRSGAEAAQMYFYHSVRQPSGGWLHLSGFLIRYVISKIS